MTTMHTGGLQMAAPQHRDRDSPVEVRFLQRLADFDEHLAAGRLKQARGCFEDLRRLAGPRSGPKMYVRSGASLRPLTPAERAVLPSPKARAEMWQVIDAQAVRPKNARTAVARARSTAARQAAVVRKEKKPNARCDRCGLPYRRGRRERGSTCSICKGGGEGSRSIRTVSGGLPTLGKRSR